MDPSSRYSFQTSKVSVSGSAAPRAPSRGVVVVRCRNSQLCIRNGLEVNRYSEIPGRNGISNGGIKIVGPFGAVGLIKVDAAQVVDHVAAGEDQHTLVPERAKTFSNFILLFRRGSDIRADDDDRDIRVRVHIAEYRPYAVVNSPVVCRLCCAVQQTEHTVCQLRGTFRGVLNLIELVREPVHIVDLPIFFDPEHIGAPGGPVGGEGDDGLRLPKPLSHLDPPFSRAVVANGVHGRTVSGKDDRHFFFHVGHLVSLFWHY